MAATMPEAIALLHRARKLVQSVKPELGEEGLIFLADSESFLIDDCGVFPRYY